VKHRFSDLNFMKSNGAVFYINTDPEVSDFDITHVNVFTFHELDSGRYNNWEGLYRLKVFVDTSRYAEAEREMSRTAFKGAL